jgi:hypothetical protein
MGSVLIRLPEERRDQLALLARRLDLPMAEAFGWLINQEISRGGLRDETPGFHITVRKNRVSFGFDNFNTPFLTPDEALQISELILLATVKNGRFGKRIAVHRPPGAIMKLARVGNGVVIEGSRNGVAARRTFPHDLAVDVARQIRVAAEQARSRK